MKGTDGSRGGGGLWINCLCCLAGGHFYCKVKIISDIDMNETWGDPLICALVTVLLGTKIPITFPKWSHSYFFWMQQQYDYCICSSGSQDIRAWQSHWLLQKQKYLEPQKVEVEGNLMVAFLCRTAASLLSSLLTVRGVIGPHRHLSMSPHQPGSVKKF